MKPITTKAIPKPSKRPTIPKFPLFIFSSKATMIRTGIADAESNRPNILTGDFLGVFSLAICIKPSLHYKNDDSP